MQCHLSPGLPGPRVLQAAPSCVVGTPCSAHAFSRGCVPRGTAGAGKSLRLETGSWVPVRLWIPRGCFGEAPGVLQEWRTHSGLPNEDGAGDGTEELKRKVHQGSLFCEACSQGQPWEVVKGSRAGFLSSPGCPCYSAGSPGNAGGSIRS